MKSQNKEDTMTLFDDAIDKLLGMNQYISAHFVTRLSKPTFADMDGINRNLGVIIKELRSVQDQLKEEKN